MNVARTGGPEDAHGGSGWSDSLTGPDVASLLRAPEDVAGEVMQVILKRARAGSTPHQREDAHVVCLAVEGGGMRAAVTAGMCFVLEAAGLTAAFDRIYGVSAGAVNGWATAAGQAALGATYYQDAVAGGVVDRTGPLWGRPLVDFDLLFEELIAARKPLSFERLARGPEFRALATSLRTLSLRVLADFVDAEELLLAARASAFLPRFAGDPPVFRGERMVDGSLLEPIPYRSALAEGATHVLVLRSRPAGYRRPPFSELGEAFAVREDPRLREILTARHGIYNRQAAALEREGRRRDARVHQIVVPENSRLVRPLDTNGQRINDTLRRGAAAMGAAVLTEPVELDWQPVLCRPALQGAVPAPAESSSTAVDVTARGV